MYSVRSSISGRRINHAWPFQAWQEVAIAISLKASFVRGFYECIQSVSIDEYANLFTLSLYYFLLLKLAEY